MLEDLTISNFINIVLTVITAYIAFRSNELMIKSLLFDDRTKIYHRVKGLLELFGENYQLIVNSYKPDSDLIQTSKFYIRLLTNHDLLFNRLFDHYSGIDLDDISDNDLKFKIDTLLNWRQDLIFYFNKDDGILLESFISEYISLLYLLKCYSSVQVEYQKDINKVFLANKDSQKFQAKIDGIPVKVEYNDYLAKQLKNIGADIYDVVNRLELKYDRIIETNILNKLERVIRLK